MICAPRLRLARERFGRTCLHCISLVATPVSAIGFVTLSGSFDRIEPALDENIEVGLVPFR